ncbi:hypothetical protein C8R45DRAFT_1097470 [Mycena sanguinolenta]|nr:hypothetical protein C8R45DRAFT_1097470 [Mycena sanguinolenta]
MKAEVLFDEYDGTMNMTKVFCGRIPLMLYASAIRGPQGVKGLFDGKSKLLAANIIQRVYHMEHITPAAIATFCTLVSLFTRHFTCDALEAIWFFSADTQIISEGDETKIDYRFLFLSFLRQIWNSLHDRADWVIDLFRYWDKVIFPNAEHSYGQTTTALRQAVCPEVDAMDAAFGATGHRAQSPLRSPERPKPEPSLPHPSRSLPVNNTQCKSPTPKNNRDNLLPVPRNMRSTTVRRRHGHQ